MKRGRVKYDLIQTICHSFCHPLDGEKIKIILKNEKHYIQDLRSKTNCLRTQLTLTLQCTGGGGEQGQRSPRCNNFCLLFIQCLSSLGSNFSIQSVPLF